VTFITRVRCLQVKTITSAEQVEEKQQKVGAELPPPRNAAAAGKQAARVADDKSLPPRKDARGEGSEAPVAAAAGAAAGAGPGLKAASAAHAGKAAAAGGKVAGAAGGDGDGGQGHASAKQARGDSAAGTRSNLASKPAKAIAWPQEARGARAGAAAAAAGSQLASKVVHGQRNQAAPGVQPDDEGMVPNIVNYAAKWFR